MTRPVCLITGASSGIGRGLCQKFAQNGYDIVALARRKKDIDEWVSESEFQFQGFGMKLFGFLMPGAFKKQSQKYLNDFKNFVENGTSVANE